MRLADGSRDVRGPSRSLYFVAIVCFGPLALVLLMGLLAVPIWVGMIAMHLADPARFSDPASGTVWDGIWPLGLVVSGFLGIGGLFRLFGTLRHGASAVSRRVTLAMIAAGLAALLAFDFVIFVPGLFFEPVEQWPVAALLIYVALPFFGTAWLLSETWQELFHGAR